MKIQQQKSQFTPITIKLEKRGEAAAFFGIIDKVEDARCNGSEVALTGDEIRLVVELSNARGGDITI